MTVATRSRRAAAEEAAHDAHALAEARLWVADCVWADVEEVAEIGDVAIMLGVEQHYDGGLAMFLADVDGAR